jgi:hypothetical protein
MILSDQSTSTSLSSTVNIHNVMSLKHKGYLNNFQKLSPYLTENTAFLHYKDQQLNAF